MCVCVCVHFGEGSGRGMTLKKVVDNIKDDLAKIKSLQRILQNQMLLPQGAPLHTLPSFVSSDLPTWPPEAGNLSWPKATIIIGQLGVSQWCENATLQGSLYWVAPPTNSGGILNRDTGMEYQRQHCHQKEETSASVFLGSGC